MERLNSKDYLDFLSRERGAWIHYAKDVLRKKGIDFRTRLKEQEHFVVDHGKIEGQAYLEQIFEDKVPQHFSELILIIKDDNDEFKINFEAYHDSLWVQNSSTKRSFNISYSSETRLLEEKIVTVYDENGHPMDIFGETNSFDEFLIANDFLDLLNEKFTKLSPEDWSKVFNDARVE